MLQSWLNSVTLISLRKKAAASSELIAEKSIELAKATAEGAKNLSTIAKLNAEIMAEKENIRKAQMQIGKRYYELFKDNPAERAGGLLHKH